MKIKLAVYTAQEGYSWQPGTAFTTEDLVAFKKGIGKFPSPDSTDFPFGGIFLLGDRVVFYRYHVAKKIDFRGRDALYCVLGAVSREDAAKIDPAALFAQPEFAGPTKPFPTELELQEANSSAVPEWLKNLGSNTLDVRITGTADNPSYAVVQEPIKIPQPPVAVPTVQETPVPNPQHGVQTPAPTPATGPASPEPKPQAEPEPQPKKMSRWMLAGIAVLALLIVALSSLAVWFCVKRHLSTKGDQQQSEQPAKMDGAQATNNDPSTATNPVPAKAGATSTTNAPAVAVQQQPVAPVTNAAPVAVAPTNTPAPANKPKVASAPLAKKSRVNPAPITKSKITPAPAAGKPSSKTKGK